ncbi:MAG: DUF3048 domain-containing protein [Clostridia bacterium]
MKKILFLLVLVISLSFTACSQDLPEEVVVTNTPTPTPTITATPEPTAEPTATPEPTIAPNVNLLTGEETLSDDAIGTRPVAVMVNNLTGSLPQYGISDADIVFEVVVESNITRLLAIYGDYTAVPDICSVRSARYYYPLISEGFDAFYVHWGWESTYAPATISEYNVDNINGSYNDYGLFGRDQDKISAGYATEHTSVFYGTELSEALENDSSIRLELEEGKTDTFFNFNTEFTPADGEELYEFTLDFGSYYSGFEYNEETGTYYKYHNGSQHVDSSTDVWLNFSNVIVLETDVSNIPDASSGIKDVEIIGENQPGYYISGGTIQKITWTKTDAEESYILYDENGDELYINTGKTYFAVGEIEYSSDLFD